MSILYISGAAALFLAALAAKFQKAFGILLLLAVPIAWLVAKMAPKYFFVSKAGSGGFITFYIKLYEKLTPEQQTSVMIAPAVFVIAFLIFRFYLKHFYVPKTESTLEMKNRVRDYYGVID